MANPGRPIKTDPKVETISFEIKKENITTIKDITYNFGINSYDSYKRTSLIYASLYDKPKIAKWLIDNKADINFQDKLGKSALHYACQEQHFETTKLLVDNNADIELKDKNGNTPLMDAIFNSKGNYEIVSLLIKSGASIDSENNYEMTPKLLAESIMGFDFDLQA